jgi:hypothetical protein
MGLPGSVNDTGVLPCLSLYSHTSHQSLMGYDQGFQNGMPPCIIGDKGYPYLPWLMTPYKEDGCSLRIVQRLYNKKLQRR